MKKTLISTLLILALLITMFTASCGKGELPAPLDSSSEETSVLSTGSNEHSSPFTTESKDETSADSTDQGDASNSESTIESSTDKEQSDNSESKPNDTSKPNGDSKPSEDTSEDESKADTSKVPDDTSKADSSEDNSSVSSTPDDDSSKADDSSKPDDSSKLDDSSEDTEKPHICAYGEWRVVRRPTTEMEGLQMRWCEICGMSQSESIDKLEPIPEPPIYDDFELVTEADAEWICNRVMQLLNEERAKVGAPALNTAPIAHEMAMVRAEELFTLFSHKRPDGRDSSTIYTDYQYNPDYDGYYIDGTSWCKPDYSSEDICTGSVNTDPYVGSDSIPHNREGVAQRVIETFRVSPGHWNDLMNKVYTGVGIGIAFREKQGGYDLMISIMTMDKTYG